MLINKKLIHKYLSIVVSTVAVWHHLHGLGPKATITRDVDEAIVEKYKEEVTEKQKGIYLHKAFLETKIIKYVHGLFQKSW